jgi:hypothetical protein
MQLFHDIDDLNKVDNLLIILFAIVAPFTVSVKAFIAAKNRLTLYRLHHAEMLIDHTVSCNSGVSPASLHLFTFEIFKKHAALAYSDTLALWQYKLGSSVMSAMKCGCHRRCCRTVSPPRSVSFPIAGAV